MMLILALGASFLLFFYFQREAIIKRFTDFLLVSIGRQHGLQVKIGKVSGNLIGSICFNQVEISEPTTSGERTVLFSAEEVRLNYHLMDFISKQMQNKLKLEIKKPVVYLVPRVGLKKNPFPYLRWIKQWALSQMNHFYIDVKDMTLLVGYYRRKVSGIAAHFDENSFDVTVPLRHLTLGDSDVSTTLRLLGKLDLGSDYHEDALIGRIWTEGTVVNWKPIAQESTFDFTLTNKRFDLTGSSLFGGISCVGSIDIENDYDALFEIKTEHLPLNNVRAFYKTPTNAPIPGSMDLELTLKGDLLEPDVQMHTRIHNAWIAKPYRAMDLHAEGIYPTLQLVNSRVYMENGVVMRFADKTVLAKELFSTKTYESMIAESTQDTVVWGDWEIKRSGEDAQQQDFMIERNLGKRARAYFKKYGYDDTINPENPKDMEIGFEYRLRAKDSLKFEVRDQEEFVGVERKLSF